MDTQTGRIYRGAEVDEAIKRGMPVVPVSERVALLMEAGRAAEKLSKKQAALARQRKRSRKRRDQAKRDARQ